MLGELWSKFLLFLNMFVSFLFFKGKLSLLEIFVLFPGGFSKWKDLDRRLQRYPIGYFFLACGILDVRFHHDLGPIAA